MSIENPNDKELLQKNKAQIQVALLLFPDAANDSDAVNKYTLHEKHPSEQFHEILKDNPGLRERVYAGEKAALEEVAEMIEL